MVVWFFVALTVFLLVRWVYQIGKAMITGKGEIKRTPGVIGSLYVDKGDKVLIGIVGRAGAGKDTVAGIISRLVPWSSIYHFADPVKAFALAIDPIVDVGRNPDGTICTARYSHIVEHYGEPVAKLMPEVRRLYQRIGTEGGRKILGPNVWTDKMRDWYYGLDPYTLGIVPDVRFVNEANSIWEEGGRIITVIRPDPYDLGENLRHASETEQLRIDSDYTISNDGDIEALGRKVQGLLAEMGI